MTTLFHNDYVFGYALTILMSKESKADGLIDYPLSRMRFNNAEEFDKSGLKSIRLDNFTVSYFSKTIDEVEHLLSGCPAKVLPKYILWNYTAENFAKLQDSVIQWFQVFLSVYNYVDKNLYDEYEEWRPYINELNSKLNLSQIGIREARRRFDDLREEMHAKLSNDVYALYKAYNNF